MVGRYGPDHLGTAMFVVALLLSIVFSLLGFVFGSYIALAILGLAIFRMYSRNIPARRRENDRFLRYYAPVKAKIKKRVSAFRERKTHKFFTCPGCHNTLRVPKGRGKIQITCPRCGERFVKKS
jgi:ribosomal protein S27E